MKSIDQFLSRIPSRQYNCLDFVKEVWAYLTGEDITEKLTRLTGPFKQRRATLSGVKAFTELTCPQTPCFVVMQRAKVVPHIGIWIDGRVLHLHDTGVEFQPLSIARRYFKSIRYYR